MDQDVKSVVSPSRRQQRLGLRLESKMLIGSHKAFRGPEVAEDWARPFEQGAKFAGCRLDLITGI